MWLIGLGIAAGACVLVAPSPPASDTWLPDELHLRVQTSEPGDIGWWWNRHAGYVSDPAASTHVLVTSTLEPVTVPCPAGRIVRGLLHLTSSIVRLDLRATIAHAGIVRAQFSLADVHPLHETCSVGREAGALIVRRNPAVRAAELEIVFHPAVVLPVPRDDLPATARTVVERERWLAAMIVAAGMLLLAGAVRASRRLVGFSGPERPWFRGLAAVFAALAILFARRPDVFALPQFWAEDGAVFFTEQRALGLAAFVQPYAGYLHLWPRLVAGIGSWFPVAEVPAIYLAGTVIVVAAAVARTISGRAQLVASPACALAIVLVPHMDELVLNLTNAQWFGAIVLLLVALSRPCASRIHCAGDLLALTLFGLTGPFVLLLLPLFAVRFWRDRDRRAGTLLAVALTLALVQGTFYVATAAAPAVTTPSAHHDLALVAAAGLRTGGEFLGLASSSSISLGLGAFASWVVFAGIACRALPAKSALMLGLAAVAVLAGGLLRYRTYPEELFLTSHAQRYFHLPVLITAWTMVAGAARFPDWRRWLCGVLLLSLFAQSLRGIRLPALVDFNWKMASRAISAGAPASIPINPAPWAVVIGGESSGKHLTGAVSPPP